MALEAPDKNERPAEPGRIYLSKRNLVCGVMFQGTTTERLSVKRASHVRLR